MADNNDFIWEPANEKVGENIKIISDKESSVLSDTLKTIIHEGDFQSLEAFLKEKAYEGQNIPIINSCISQVLKSEDFHYINFWAFVRVLIVHDATLFLATISKNISQKTSVPSCNPFILEDIVENAFKATEKLHHAINLVSIVSKQLSFDQKEYILNSCLKTSNPDTLNQAFKMLEMPPAFVISFLRNKLENPIVLYTLFDYYHTANKGKEISDNTLIEVFSTPYINILIRELKKKGGQCRDVADLIEYDLHIVSRCKNISLYKLVLELGHKGFVQYYGTIRGKNIIEENIRNIKFDEQIYNFKVIGKLKNYNILLHMSTNLRTLLPIELSENVSGSVIHAFIYKYDKANNLLYARQKDIPKNYIEPNPLELGSEVTISFSLHNGILYPRLRRMTGLFKIKVSNIDEIENYRLKYKAIVKKKIGAFRYLVDIIDTI